MAESIYKDKNINIPVSNNTVSQPLAVNNLKPNTNTNIQSIYPTYPIEEIIGERLNTREKNYIKGMMHNLQKQIGLSISSPEQLFAEIVFTVLNEEQLQGINDFNHRIQIIAKLLRQKRWLTPKGFYNHADFGVLFRKDLPKSNKTTNDSQLTYKSNHENKTQLKQQSMRLRNQFDEHCRLISTETKQFKEATYRFKHESGSIQLVNSISATLITYYQQQIMLHQDISVLEEVSKTKSSSPEHSIKNDMKNLTLLQHQEQQLRDLVHTVFDIFCDTSKASPDKEGADRAYQHYELLSELLVCIEKKIRHLEEQLEYQYVA